MMYESSLPIWSTILIVDFFIAIVCGLLGPYVPKADKERADAYLHDDRKGERPVVTVSVRGFFGYTVLIVLVIALFSVVAFLLDGFSVAVANAGGGLFATTAVVIGMFFVYVLVGSGLILVAMMAAYVTSLEIEKYYKGYYHVEVKQEIY